MESISLESIKSILKVLAKSESETDPILKVEESLLREIPSINDSRNLFIGTNKLGLTREKKLTPKGYVLYGHLKNSNTEFERELIKLLEPTFKVVLNAIVIFARDTNQSLKDLKFTHKDLEKEIEKIFGEKVNYFDYRRLSYIVNLLCDLKFLTKLGDRSIYKVEKITF